MKHLAQFQRSRSSAFIIAGVVIAILCAGTVVYAESAPNLEVHIANNGFVLIRNATITSISGTTIEAEITWGSSTLTWEVQTDGKTDFVRSDGEKGTLTGLTEGNIITITGELDSDVGGANRRQDRVRAIEWRKGDAVRPYGKRYHNDNGGTRPDPYGADRYCGNRADVGTQGGPSRRCSRRSGHKH